MDRETSPQQTVSPDGRSVSAMESGQVQRQPTSRQADDAPDLQKTTRRDFLKLGLGALSALAVLEVGGASLLFLRARSMEGKFGGVVTVGSIDSFPPGSVTEFPEGRFFLIRSYEGGFLAVHSRCPHLGCSVYWAPEEDRFFCPCHASSFDFYGNFENPPVPRALDIFAVQIEGTTVKVDTSKLQSREFFAPEQLTHA